MANIDRITALAQSIYIARHNQANDATGSDLTDFLNQTIEWVNQFIPELEVEADWNFSRTNDDTIGTVSQSGAISLPLPSTLRKLVINPHRDLTIQQDGTVVSTFKLVNPNQVKDPTDTDIRDRATVVNGTIIFSRKLNDTELNGTVVADSIASLPLLAMNDTTLLDTVTPIQLIVLGVLKNQILPDIVQGGLTPSFTQKYADLLQKTIQQNNESADADDADRDNFSNIGGTW